MLLLAALTVTTAWSYGFAQETPIQSPVSITMSRVNTDLKCHFKDFSGNFDNTVIHWYQQKENKAPVRMIYFTSGRTKVNESFQRHRYRIQTIPTQRLCTLTIRNVIPDDAATYYCAYWDPRRILLQSFRLWYKAHCIRQRKFSTREL
nr:T-cell receptor gamma chain Vg2-Jg1 [Gallus gallus]